MLLSTFPLSSLSLFVLLASAHFQPNYPLWRGDSFNPGYSQIISPCAGFSDSTNRTLWPLTGGSVNIMFYHPSSYLFINLAIGNDDKSLAWNLSLTGPFLNQTGEGVLCLPELPIPTSFPTITEGMNASLQFVTSDEFGSSLYNCADITFSSSATLLSGTDCINSSGVSVGPFLVDPAASIVKSEGGSLSTAYAFAFLLAVGISCLSA